MPHDVLLWGTYFCDLIYAGLDDFPRLGIEIYSRRFEILPGGCYTTAVALQRLGLDVVWACDFGDDLFSRFVLQAALDERLSPELFRRHPFPVRRVTTAVSYTTDRAFISFIDEVPLTPVLDQLRDDPPRWLLLPHLHDAHTHAEVFAAANRAGVRIFMDCQSTSANLATPGIAEAIGAVDIFTPNAVEALTLTGAATPEEALGMLAGIAPLVIIKLGDQGAIARTGDVSFHAAAFPADVVDTTGAGDCFNAGFLYGLLKGAPVQDCLAYANACGALSTLAPGGQAAPAAAQVEDLMQHSRSWARSLGSVHPPASSR